jgi:hypothetical protein
MLRLPTEGRTVEVDATGTASTAIDLPVPPGAYRSVQLELATLSARAGPGEDWKLVRTGGVISLPMDCDLAANDEARVDVVVDTELLVAKPEGLERAVRIGPPPTVIEPSASVGRDGTRIFEFPLPPVGTRPRTITLVAPAGALSPTARVVLEEHTPDDLPPLLRRQRAAGPVVRLTSSEPPRSPLEVTVPYDEAIATAAGRSVTELVVLALDEDRRVYRELPAARVDRARGTLTARTRRLSFFFAGTPGVEIAYPEFRANAAGEVLAISSQATALVWGRALDENALVACEAATGGWSRFGWFVYDGISLGPGERVVRLTVSVEWLVTHEVELVFRRPPPLKRVTEPARLFGTSLAVSPGNFPFVGAVINQSEFRVDHSSLVPAFSGWQRSFDRPAPYVYWFDFEGGGWRHIALMPDTHLENLVAAEVIRALGEVWARPIPLDPAHPEEVRALLSLRDFYQPILDRGDLVSLLVAIAITDALTVAGRRFGAGNYSYSPTIPVVSDSDDEVEVAFVAAAAEPSQLAAADPMQLAFGDVVVPNVSDQAVQAGTQRPLVHAGTLFYARARRDNVVEREPIATDVWCHAVALHHNPATGRATVLALRLEPPADEEPRTRLALFERRAPGEWEPRTVSADLPIFDADFAFLPDGSVRIVASFVGSRPDKAHLVVFEPEGDGWSASPLSWFASEDPNERDIGAFGRIVAAADGKIAVGFLSPVPRLDLGVLPRWMLAVQAEGGWQALTLGRGTLRSLSGDLGYRRDNAFATGFVGQSGRGGVAFAPALAAHADGTIEYVFGNGVLMLATIDPESLTTTVRSVDVDRQTGFAPSLTLTPRGVPTIASKDDFGPGDKAPGARDHLHFFTMEAGNLVPDPGFAVPLAPSHGLTRVSVTGFVPYRPLTCRTLLDPAESEALLDSLLAHRKFHVETVEGGGERVVWGVHWAFYHSHRSLNQMIDNLAERPSILELTIDNEEHADEEGIERLHITFIDALATVGGDHQAALDAGSFPDELRVGLVARGFRMSRPGDIQVERRLDPGEDANAPGRRWTVTDPNPFNETRLALPDGGTDREPVAVVYEMTRRDDGLFEFRVPPLLTVVDRPRFVDADGNAAPCGVARRVWDEVEASLSPDLRRAAPNLAGSIPNARWVRIRNAYVSAIEPEAFPGEQQNAMRLTLTVGSVWARGRYPELFNAAFEAYTTEPSQFRLFFAPFIDGDARLRWWPRATQAHLGRVEVDVRDFGELQFLATIAAFIPLIGNPLAIVIADAVADDIATDKASDAIEAPGLGDLPNLLLERFQAYVERQLPLTGPFDAAYLDGSSLNLWWRPPLRETPRPTTDLSALPETVNLGVAVSGRAPPNRRNLLLTNPGSLPLVLESAALVQTTDEIRIAVPLAWPRVLVPGDSEVVTFEFAPRLPPGERHNAVRVRYDRDQLIEVELRGFADPPPRPVARLEPEILNFYVVDAGGQRSRNARLFNDGDDTLQVRAIEIDPEPAAKGVFTATSAQLLVRPHSSIAVPVTYAPQAGVAVPHRAALRVRTNDADRPVVEIALFGEVASGALLVDPLRIAFNPSPLAAALPPGLGSARVVNVYNTGAAPLTITAASFTVLDPAGAPSASFVLSDGSSFPPPPIQPSDQTIAPGAVLPLTIVFRPVTAGDHVARLVITPTEAMLAPVTVEITGTGVG